MMTLNCCSHTYDTLFQVLQVTEGSYHFPVLFRVKDIKIIPLSWSDDTVCMSVSLHATILPGE